MKSCYIGLQTALGTADVSTSRSNHQRCSIKKSVLKNFVKLTGKHLCQSLLFNKVAGWRPATLLKKRLWNRCFPVKFSKFLRTPFLQNNSRRLLLLLTNNFLSYERLQYFILILLIIFICSVTKVIIICFFYQCYIFLLNISFY